MVKLCMVNRNRNDRVQRQSVNIIFFFKLASERSNRFPGIVLAYLKKCSRVDLKTGARSPSHLPPTSPNRIMSLPGPCLAVQPTLSRIRPIRRTAKSEL